VSDDPRTWVTGEQVTAPLLNAEIRDRWNEARDWVDYTPTWTATGGTPSLGNGTLLGRYRRSGHVCDVNISLTLGSSSNVAGTTLWSFLLPVMAASPAVFTAMALDFNTAWLPCAGFLVAFNTAVQLGVPAGGRVGATVPFTWGQGDALIISGTYEV
jgi:hypothetical protein